MASSNNIENRAATGAEEAPRAHHREVLVAAQRIAHFGTWCFEVCEPLVTWSDELYRICGRAPSEFQPTREAYVECVHPDDREIVRASMARAITRDAPFAHDERVVWPDGTVRYVHTWGQPLFDAAGRLRTIAGVVQDVTDRRLVEIALEKSLADARRAVQVRDDFLSMASHELRTPLTPLALQLQLLRKALRESASSADARPGGGAAMLASHGRELVRLVDASQRQLERLTRLVDDLLEVTRIHSGRLTLSLEEVDLSGLVLGVVERAAPELRHARCAVETRIAPGVTGRWDRIRIEQLVANLLSNAARYGAGKPIRVDLTSDASTATLRLRDFGIGIAQEDRSRVFDRFERAVSLRDFGGLGLGLYIAREIVQSHGGTIRVESAVGAGSTFVVELPLRPAAPLA